MGNTPQDQDLLDKIRDLETRLGNLERRSGLSSASISSGGLTIQDGGDLTVKDGGGVSVEGGGDVIVSGGGDVTVNDGGVLTVRGGNLVARNAADFGYFQLGPSGPGYASFMYRQGGSLAVLVDNDLTLWDRLGNAIFYDDPAGGLGGPYLQTGHGVSLSVPTDTTTSGTFQPLQRIFHRKLHQKILAVMLVNLTAGTGEWRLRDNGSGTVIGATHSVSAGFTYAYFGPDLLPGSINDFLEIDAQARVVSGGGTIGLRCLMVEGQE